VNSSFVELPLYYLPRSVPMTATTQKPSLFNPLQLNLCELRAAYRVFLKDPGQGILHILAAGQGSPWQRWVEKRRAAQAASLAGIMLEIDLQVLLQLPADTLGGAYARHMSEQGFNPQAFVKADDTWITRRTALGHDVYHILTGFDAQPIGEFGLAAFCFVQSWDLLNLFVLSFVPLSMLRGFNHASRLSASLFKGFTLGVRSKPLVGYAFEQNWEKPLQKVRHELGIA
jgi:Coenzyme Q (ubiquinone) biosynthesis protein Coq4